MNLGGGGMEHNPARINITSQATTARAEDLRKSLSNSNLVGECGLDGREVTVVPTRGTC